ncbi:MAG TPA: hypothetical protein VHB93_00725 [Candidatus Paceibacterota bacterium]|nr:hypothetical protein [Candidatus Paceibacterota bacterium]
MTIHDLMPFLHSNLGGIIISILIAFTSYFTFREMTAAIGEHPGLFFLYLAVAFLLGALTVLATLETAAGGSAIIASLIPGIAGAMKGLRRG